MRGRELGTGNKISKCLVPRWRRELPLNDVLNTVVANNAVRDVAILDTDRFLDKAVLLKRK